MKKLEGHTEPKWIIAYSNDLSTFHFTKVEVGKVCQTGQSNFEVLDTEKEWIDRIDELKGDGWYERQTEEI